MNKVNINFKIEEDKKSEWIKEAKECKLSLSDWVRIMITLNLREMKEIGIKNCMWAYLKFYKDDFLSAKYEEIKKRA